MLRELHEIELKVLDVTRLKAIWEAVKPKKRLPLLPSNWKRRDLEAFKQLYHDTVVPDLELPNDYHWARWGKAKLTMGTWEEMAKETGHGLDHTDLFEKEEDNCKAKMAEKPDKKPPNHAKEQDKKPVILNENPDQLFRPKGRTRKADLPGEQGNAVSSDGSWIPMGKMEAREVSSGDTKEEMEEIMNRRKDKAVNLGPVRQESLTAIFPM